MFAAIGHVLLATARLTLLTSFSLVALQTFWQIMLAVIHRVSGHHERTIRHPAHSTPSMLLSNVLGYAGYNLPWCLARSWMEPSLSWELPNFVHLGYFTLVGMFIGDFYYYTVHRWFHLNKTAFRLFHAKHHEPGAQMDATTAGHVNFFGAILEGGLALGVLHVLSVCTFGNWWFVYAPLHFLMSILILGHTGHDMLMDSPLQLWSILLPNPMFLWYCTTPIRNCPNDHEDHHINPRSNYAPFFTFWDDLFGTSATQRLPCSFLILAAHAVYQATLVATGYLLYKYPVQLLTAYIATYVVVAPMTAAAVGNVLKLPELVQYSFGWLMDCYRADSAITYIPAGLPGSFAYSRAAQQNPEVQPDAAGNDGVITQQQQPAYIFGCHPAGVLSRGAFHTFALKGWKSPVSSVQGLRFAIGDQLFYAPILLFREFMIMAGCIPADKTTLVDHVTTGNSVALTPAGLHEVKHVRTNSIVLEKRKGFVALARETGAVLVPVLCIGEQDVVVPPRQSGENYKYKGMQWWVWMFLLAHRPYPIKVVFGPALSAAVGESVDELHVKYTAALVQLGKKHGMELQVV